MVRPAAWESVLYADARRPSAALPLPPYYSAFGPAYPRANARATNGAIPYFLMRSDWGPDATWAAVHMGAAWYDDHQHVDAGHLLIARGRDALLIDASNWKGAADSCGIVGSSSDETAGNSGAANTNQHPTGRVVDGDGLGVAGDGRAAPEPAAGPVEDVDGAAVEAGHVDQAGPPVDRHGVVIYRLGRRGPDRPLSRRHSVRALPYDRNGHSRDAVREPILALDQAIRLLGLIAGHDVDDEVAEQAHLDGELSTMLAV